MYHEGVSIKNWRCRLPTDEGDWVAVDRGGRGGGRAQRKSSFYGVYIFGDHESRRIFGLTREKGSLQSVRPTRHIAATESSPSAAMQRGNCTSWAMKGRFFELTWGKSRSIESSVLTLHLSHIPV